MVFRYSLAMCILSGITAATSPLRGSTGRESTEHLVTEPCSGQSVQDILKYKLTCDGSIFVAPEDAKSGYYYYASGKVVAVPITSYRTFHFEYQVDPKTKESFLGGRHDFDLNKDPFDVPMDIIESNGGICIPFGKSIDCEDG